LLNSGIDAQLDQQNLPPQALLVGGTDDITVIDEDTTEDTGSVANGRNTILGSSADLGTLIGVTLGVFAAGVIAFVVALVLFRRANEVDDKVMAPLMIALMHFLMELCFAVFEFSLFLAGIAGPNKPDTSCRSPQKSSCGARDHRCTHGVMHGRRRVWCCCSCCFAYFTDCIISYYVNQLRVLLWHHCFCSTWLFSIKHSTRTHPKTTQWSHTKLGRFELLIKV
jgi:hypothetical protein